RWPRRAQRPPARPARARRAGSRSPAPLLPGGPALEALAAAPVTQAAQAPDEQRVVVHGLGVLDQAVEDLVIARRRQREPVADGCLLRTGLGPPRALEVQDGPISVGQRHGSSVAKVPT